MERNHITIASSLSIIGIYRSTLDFFLPDEIKAMPSYPTFARRLKKYGEISYTSPLNHVYRFRAFAKDNIRK